MQKNYILQHPSLAIVKGAGLVMKAIIEEADSETAAKMQELALAEVSLQIIFQLVLETLFFFIKSSIGK